MTGKKDTVTWLSEELSRADLNSIMIPIQLIRGRVMIRMLSVSTQGVIPV